VKLNDIINTWDFDAILLATGAWRDRSLPVPGIDDFVGKGFYYQNAYVHWFNHKHEPGYRNEQIEALDNAIIVGGGLASLDMAKIVMMETVLKALKNHGIQIDLFTLEKRGIAETLNDLNLTMQQLNLQGCTLFYRRRTIDMPLSVIPPDADSERINKAYESRKKILENFQNKYLFRFEELSFPVDKIVDNGNIAGLIFQKTKIQEGQIVPISGSEFEVRGSQVISSIGSIPEKIEGMPMRNNLFEVQNEETGQISGYENLYALGNAVTGRGNIRASSVHGKLVTEQLLKKQFAWREEDYELLLKEGAREAKQKSEQLAEQIQNKKLKSSEEILKIVKMITRLQKQKGYNGKFNDWVKKHLPVRLEQLGHN